MLHLSVTDTRRLLSERPKRSLGFIEVLASNMSAELRDERRKMEVCHNCRFGRNCHLMGTTRIIRAAIVAVCATYASTQEWCSSGDSKLTANSIYTCDGQNIEANLGMLLAYN